ncbi:MAG: hypothetical protein H2174_04850 [Vampirovibrio sp.]|nr:hypothetical protein [Vampirovibrio sp.]
MNDLRRRLVETALEWEKLYGVAPSITSAISEYDAALLIGLTPNEYQSCMQGRTAVSRGFDFICKGNQYQVKANRPSGKKGSKVTLVGKATNYEWDFLIWVHYNPAFEIQEVWLLDRDFYIENFDSKKRLSPNDMRKGSRLL